MEDKIVNIINEVPFVGEDGLDYVKVTKEILTPRKTYLKGTIKGKYRGNKIPDDSDKSDLFDFEIYEAEVNCNSIDDFSKNRPFVFPNDFKYLDGQKRIKGKVFPKSKLPEILPVIISANNKTFGINVLEPQLFEFEINRKNHQTERDEVFGTFNAYVTGYVFDYEREEEEEIIGPIADETFTPEPIEPEKVSPCKSSTIETGKTETKGNYIRKEFKCINHNDNVWGKWEYKGRKLTTPPTGYSGCLSEIIGGIGLLLFIGFLIAILPGFIYFIGFFAIIFLISILAPYLKWIFKILGIILLLAFLGSLVKTCTNSSHVYTPAPIIIDPREANPKIEPPIIDSTSPIIDTLIQTETDSLITRYRNWNDYDGNNYQGKYQISLSSFKSAHYNKNNLSLRMNSTIDYNEIVFNLKEFDKNKLDGVYKLFDSIGKTNKMDKVKFAKMIVTFVQDIPYAIVLDGRCEANLYDDKFTRDYLLNNKGECDGPQRFGINTPIEFLVNQKGDCDTRTLLLYTIFSHYDYDVAMLSSEFYGHSIIGINLPISGLSYNYYNQRYVLWETTAPNAKPGQIPNEISNLNNWRISLKSK
ncbi:hypothetical protein ACSVH2_08730 [Flavobacterium sp. RSB2_4_14]|uniref:hypothetical protein n=1 Tax=Flavobacterium sp. RSB2_4_14 TaxID=3447665 RepID=UPI003F363860